jgi:hypothetical protein
MNPLGSEVTVNNHQLQEIGRALATGMAALSEVVAGETIIERTKKANTMMGETTEETNGEQAESSVIVATAVIGETVGNVDGTETITAGRKWTQNGWMNQQTRISNESEQCCSGYSISEART